jgi:hypothetical protein
MVCCMLQVFVDSLLEALNHTIEMQVAARVKESTQEINALNHLLQNMREEEAANQAKHKEQLERTRKLAQERVATAQAAVTACEKAQEQLQEKVTIQLKDAAARVHQAEAKLLAVRCILLPELQRSLQSTPYEQAFMHRSRQKLKARPRQQRCES